MENNNELKIFRPINAGELIRLGNEFDGGYIVHLPSLADVDVLVNYGVGYNVAFEKDFFEKTKAPVLAFDPTLKSVGPILRKLTAGEFVPFLRHVKNYLSWRIRERSLPESGIQYIEEGLADTDEEGYKTLAYHYEKYGLADKKIILKIDIEGAEYPVFNNASVYPLLRNAVQIIIEFHDLQDHMLELMRIMHALSRTHALIHIHANNHVDTFNYRGKNVPDAIEVTFLHNSFITNRTPSTASYPVAGLDSPCHKLKKDIPLEFFY